jgi:ribonuclease G
MLERAAELSAGDSLVVQILRDARGGKLGVATQSIALAGRALIHLPLESGVKTSRRFDGDEARHDALLVHLVDKPGGWILRRNAARVDEADFAAEITALAEEGAHIRNGGAASPPDAARRLLSDYGAPSPERLLVSGADALKKVSAWSRAFAPSLAGRIVRDQGSLFDLHDLDAAIVDLASPHVALPFGGSLVIERTEALTVIDVNAGGEPNALAANLAAATEIARQLRLRHIGGIVVVDFVSMTRPADRTRVQDKFKSALAEDLAQTYLLPMSALGLVEMTRERRGPGLEVGG